MSESERRKDAWTQEHDQKMIEMREQRFRWIDIGKTLGRTVESCCARYRTVVPEEKRARYASSRRWPEQEELQLKQMLADGIEPRCIAEVMRKPRKVIYSKIQYLQQVGREVHLERISRVEVPVHCLEDRDRRIKAERNLTAIFFGDPAPGQSALDKKQGAFA